MVIGFIVDALIPSGGVGSTITPANTTGEDVDDKINAKEWTKNKLQALSFLLGKLAANAWSSITWDTRTNHKLDSYKSKRSCSMVITKSLGIDSWG